MNVFRMIVPLSLLAISGFAQDVRYNFDRSTDFSNYKTYKWVQIKDAAQLPPLGDRQLKDAIDAELARKGLAKVEGENPADLLIGYQAAVAQEKQFNSYSTGFGPGWGFGAGWGYGGSTMTTGETSTIHIGSIGLDMYDAGKQQLVWRGTASKTLDTKANPDKVQKNLNKAVAKLLKNYPPQAKK